ncbi:hypothetical protein CAS74_002255 [Pichia kudriavzevii]|uniref:Proline-rich protein LAS17 n=1 Tax=Pichia kudriavzevii TaxID=4909 RepID=A0A1Z8JPK1_PICKU|nr:hypothetical protein CAS74_002255 [Pichia kudriavzevii]
MTLTSQDKNIVRASVSKANNKIIDAAIVRLYVATTSSDRWVWSGLMGALVLVEDTIGHTFFFKLIDITERRGILWDQEIYVDFQYTQDRKFFHSFEIDNAQIGFLFDSISNAQHFYKRVTTREKHASTTTLNNYAQVKSRKHPEQTPHFDQLTSGSINHRIRRSRGLLYYEKEPPPEWRPLYNELEKMGITEDMIAENRDFIKDYINKQGGPLVGLEPPIPRRYQHRQQQRQQENNINDNSPPISSSSSMRKKKAPPPPPPQPQPQPQPQPSASLSPSPSSPHLAPATQLHLSEESIANVGGSHLQQDQQPALQPLSAQHSSNSISPPFKHAVPPPLATQNLHRFIEQTTSPAPPPRNPVPPPLIIQNTPLPNQSASPAPPPRGPVPLPRGPSTPLTSRGPRASTSSPFKRPVPPPPPRNQPQPTQRPGSSISPASSTGAVDPTATTYQQQQPLHQQPLQPSHPPPQQAALTPPHQQQQSLAPPPPPPPPLQTQTAPPAAGSSAAPPPPPPPGMPVFTPPPAAGPAQTTPAISDDRDALLASIRNAGGVGALRKVDKSQLDKPSVLLQEAKGEAPTMSSAGANTSNSGAPASLADALAAALSSRKAKVANSDNESDGDW